MANFLRMCKLTEFFTKITIPYPFFLFYLGMQFCFNFPLYSQINTFPYQQSFEDPFSLGAAIEFLPHWWGNDIRDSKSRIYQTAAREAFSGQGALAFVPTSSFSPEVRFFFEAISLSSATISFWARSGKKGSGSRPSRLAVSFSADGGETFLHPSFPAGEEGFPNANTAYQQYQITVPPEVLESRKAMIRLEVTRGMGGEGTAAAIFMDDFRISSEALDFRLLKAQAAKKQELILFFNKTPDKRAAENILHYQINKGIEVLSAGLDADNPKQVKLFTTQLEAGSSYTIELGAVLDKEGNSAAGQQAGFVFEETYELQPYDLLISEIHPSPDENTLLPNVEWVELYNASGRPLQLEGLSFGDMSRTTKMPAFSMEAGSFLLLAPAAEAAQLEKFGPVAGLSSWPSLNNGGDELSLYNAAGQLLDRVVYEDSWYGNSEKAAGGWSLERIDLGNPCIGAANWSASVHHSGGSPAAANSIAADKPDLRGPQLLQAFALDSLTIYADFNEAIDTSFLLSASTALSPSLAIQHLKAFPAKPDRLLVKLQAPLSKGSEYNIRFQNLLDCSGNLLQADFATAIVAVPEPALEGDLVFNELMYDPALEGEEWVEVVNASSKYLNLMNWQLASYADGIKKTTVVKRDYLILPPSGLLVFSRNTDAVSTVFPSAPSDRLMQLKGMLQLPNEGDSLVLIDEDGKLIDKFGYYPKLHSPFIRNTKGVSLERIKWEASSNEAGNWTSAAASANYGTPGQPNSQRFSGGSYPEDQLVVEPQLILPPGNGQDYASIRFTGSRPGLQATLRIFDAQGREVRTLAANEALGTEAFFSWDGTSADRRRVASGYYVVLLQVLDASGYQQHFQTTVVVAN